MWLSPTPLFPLAVSFTFCRFFAAIHINISNKNLWPVPTGYAFLYLGGQALGVHIVIVIVRKRYE